MNASSVFAIKIMLVTLILCFSNVSNSQVDPEWLKSWNEAVEMRPEKLSSTSKIVSELEPGITLVVHGQIFEPDGIMVADNVLIHMYHRDHEGFDFGQNDNSLSTWRLQGWAKSDSEGKFEFQTIKPAPDHIGREGGHIHFTIVSADYGKQWVQKLFFLDDSSISDKERAKSKAAGLFGWIKELKTIGDTQHVNVNIKLKEKPDF